MLQTRTARVFLLSFLCLSHVWCSRDKSKVDASLPAATRAESPFIVLGNAYDIQHQSVNGEEHMVYSVREDYPPEGSLATIFEILRTKGWTPRPEDVFNPGSPSSHVEGWQTFVDGTVTPHKTKHQWIGEWSDEEGRILMYALQFSCSIEDRVHSSEMKVSIALMHGDTSESR